MEDLVRNYPQGDPALFNIGLLHTSLNGRPGHEPYAPCSLDTLRSKGYHYWALGHVHQREEICRAPWVVFPGNIQGRNIRETGAKGCTLVTVREGDIMSVEHRELDVLRWALCRVDLARCEQIDSLPELVREVFEVERAKADGRPMAVRLILEGITPLHALLHENAPHWNEEVRAVAANIGELWIEKVMLNTRKRENHSDIVAGDSPVESLMGSVETFQFDSLSLLETLPEFAKLHSKLPADLLSDGDPFRPVEEELVVLRDDVKELLMGKIQQRGSHEN